MTYTSEATYVLNGENVEFKYNDRPSLTDKMSIVDDIVEGVINENVGYKPILFNYFVAVAIIEHATDITLPQSFVESSDFIDKTEIMTILATKFSPDFIPEIMNAAFSEIEFIKNKIMRQSKLDDLFTALTNTVNKYAEAFDGLDINEVLDKLTKINEIANIPEEELVRGILKVEEKNKESD